MDVNSLANYNYFTTFALSKVKTGEVSEEALMGNLHLSAWEKNRRNIKYNNKNGKEIETIYTLCTGWKKA
jgi:hypothetical protein